MSGGAVDHQDTATTQGIEEADLDQEAMNELITEMDSKRERDPTMMIDQRDEEWNENGFVQWEFQVPGVCHLKLL